MTRRVWCSEGWDAHIHCDGRFCDCDCHIVGKPEWDEWQHHVAECHWCRDVVRGVRLGRCAAGDLLVAEFNKAIH